MSCRRTTATICTTVHSWYEMRTSKSPCHYALTWSNDVRLVVDHDVQYQSLCQSVQNGKGYDGNRRCSHGFEIVFHCLSNKGCPSIQCADGWWSHCIDGRRWFWGCRQMWHCPCLTSWLVSAHFQTTCGIHGSTLSVVISLRWGWMASEYFVQWCYCWCRFGWRACGRIWASKKTLQCDNGQILWLSTSTSRHWWHSVASGWPIEASIHCGCLCGYWTKPLAVLAPESKKTSCGSLSKPLRHHHCRWQ